MPCSNTVTGMREAGTVSPLRSVRPFDRYTPKLKIAAKIDPHSSRRSLAAK